jgi:precorrin-6Y C5,15-methyltransferase (decarboxylating)
MSENKQKSEQPMKHPVLIVGVGAEGPASLAPGPLERIARADQLWGGQRLLAHWASHPAQKVVVGADVAQRVWELAQRGDRRVVILASGDPGFYGIAATVLRALPAEEIEIVPHVSSLQLAFARIGVDWNEATLTSAHSRPLSEIVGWARRAQKLGILTDGQHTPSVIARTLLDAGLANCRAVVAENLGLPDECITDTRLARLPDAEFGPLNVLLLIQDEGWRPWPAFAPRSEEAYAHSRGLITKREVRALSLAWLALRETDVVWDIGAGSGAVSVEMAELAWRGQVYAVERDVENVAYIRQNAARFGVLNVSVVSGCAPQVLAELPRPSAAFIGGTGGAMEPILRHIGGVARPGCRVVANLATLENLVQMLHVTRELGWATELAQVSIAHGTAIAGLTRLAPLNPVFILSGQVRCDE